MTAPVTIAEIDKPVSRFLRQVSTVLRDDQTVRDAMESLRGQETPEKIIYFYVINVEEQLVGVVPVRQLLLTPLDEKVGSLMNRDIVSIQYDQTVLDACETFLNHRLLGLPVVDKKNRLLGAIDISMFTDEVMSVVRQQQVTNAFQLIGVHVALGRSTPWTSFKDRFPWLLCNVAGGFACAMIAGYYEHVMQAAILVAAFIPVVLALAESVCIQSMTLSLQSTSHRRLSWRLLFRTLRKELLTAGMLGLAGGSLVGLLAYLWRRDASISLALGLSIWLSVMTASLLGLVVPAFVHALKVDPKIASGPIVLAATDMLTLVFYLNLSFVLLT